MNPVELECTYPVSESTSEPRLNPAVPTVMNSGLVTSQVPSNLFLKKLNVIILGNGLGCSMALPVLFITVINSYS